MTYPVGFAEAARQHVYENAGEIDASNLCCCHNCRNTFPVSDITEWLNPAGETTFRVGPSPTTARSSAMCPTCGFDWVIGDASGLPVSDPEFWDALGSVLDGRQNA